MERALLAEGIEVTTATTDDDGHRKRNGKKNGIACDENGAVRYYFRKQIDFYKVSMPLAVWLKHRIRNYHLVHVHALFSHASIAACRAARSAGVPYIIRPLGVLNRYGMSRRRAQLKRVSFRWLEGPLLRDAAAVHFTSIEEQKDAEDLGVPMLSAVIPLGLELPEVAPDLILRRPFILFLSRLDPKKNLEELLKAWALLAREFPAWKLAIAGDGETNYVRRLRMTADELGIAKQIEWLGRIEGSTKARWFGEASIYVLPSYSENFGIAAVEAMSFGLPCLLGEGVAVAREASRNGGCRLTKTDASQIREGLRVLLSDEAQRRQLGAAARQFALQEYGVKIMGHRLRALYEGILNDYPEA